MHFVNFLSIYPLLTAFAVYLAPIIQSQTLCITRGHAAPDCVSQQEAFLVNGEFTGPVIYAQINSVLRVTVVNDNNSPMSIHFHGLHQRGSQFADGAAGITNAPILPGETRSVDVNIGCEPGTYYYHAHFGLISQHVYGALVITDPAERKEYDDERVILLSDYWHEKPEVLLEGLHAPVFKFVGAPQSFLTNGMTIAGNCSTGESGAYNVVSVEKGKRYRLRIIGATTLFSVNFHIPGHSMRVIEVDGQMVDPFQTEYLEVFSGQRYSVIVVMDQNPGDYWMQMKGKWRSGAPENGFSILRYADSIPETVPVSIVSPPELINGFDAMYRPLVKRDIPPATTFVTIEGMQATVDNRLRWVLNNISYMAPPDKSILAHAVDDTLYTLPSSSKPLLIVPLGEVVEIVFQNLIALNGVCETHPWHIHGHSFYVMSSGPGKHDPNHPDFESPMLRDTVALYASQNAYNQEKGTAGTPCGWTRVRFIADNPGAWALHCHISSHFSMGMGTTIVVAKDLLQDTFVGPPISAPVEL